MTLLERLKGRDWSRAPWPALYVGALGAAMVGFNVLSPIFAGDFDLWYHLNGGRFFWQHGAVPQQAFFSFLTPRPWPDYYWLFQVVVYAVHRALGYQGLVLLRGGLWTATLAALLYLLSRRDGARLSAATAGFFSLYAAFLIPRFLLVRPHLCSYPLLLLSLILLESPRRIQWLPLVALLWGNLHGIYYPVFLLLCGAYAAEHYVSVWAGREKTEEERRVMGWLAASLVAFFATPLAGRLGDVPFVSLDYAGRAISELIPFHIDELVSASVFSWAPSQLAAFDLIFFAAVLAVAAGVWARTVRVSHLLLFAGGCFLLSRGRRFEYECALLALPLLCSSFFWDEGALRLAIPAPARALALAGLMLMPFCVISFVAASRPRHYPLSLRNLPHGVTAFLDRVSAGGTVLNYPSIGGYLEWELYPRYKIGMDLQTPFLFNDNDLYLMQMAFHETKFLRLAVSQYHPDFIAAPLREPQFSDVIAPLPGYVPVFFDDTAVLYVDGARHGDIVRDYALPYDPWHLAPPKADVEVSSKPAPGCGLPPFLSRMLALDPHIFMAQSYAAAVCEAHHDFKEELAHAEAALGDYPEEPRAYLLKGTALKNLGQTAAAEAVLRQGLRAAPEGSGSGLRGELANVFMDEKLYDKAIEYARDADRTLPPRTWTWPQLDETPPAKAP